MVSSFFIFLTGISVGIIIFTWLAYRIVKVIVQQIVEVVERVIDFFTSSTSAFMMLVRLGAFIGFVVWHEFFDLRKNQLIDYQELDNKLLDFLEKRLWPKIVHDDMPRYPVFIVWVVMIAAQRLKLDVTHVPYAPPPSSPPTTLPPPPPSQGTPP